MSSKNIGCCRVEGEVADGLIGAGEHFIFALGAQRQVRCSVGHRSQFAGRKQCPFPSCS